MRKRLFAIAWLISPVLMAGEGPQGVNGLERIASDYPFSEAFDGMFDIQTDPVKVYLPQEVGNPAVPLDGGLTALLLAGGAAGYRQYKKKRA